MAEPLARTLTWTADGTPAAVVAMLRELATEYPLVESGLPAATVRFVEEPGRDGALIDRTGPAAVVHYGRLSHAGRAIGTLLADLAPANSTHVEVPAFSTLGVLLDCGHNPTITTAHLRRWMRRLALLGFNTAMVYTEAGYRLPDEPCFGYQRGAYTPEEMQALDAQAAALGVELIGSIQALGHLEQALKWGPNVRLRDTEHTLLVGDPGTAALVDKMVAFWAATCRSRRLHVGMDETYDLGRGRYLDQHGYRPGLEIYTEHLRLVADTCRRHGVRPMVWSDVLFRLAGGSGHYDPSSAMPEHVRAALPDDVDLVYWDYYNADPAHYLARLEQHRNLGYEPVMASGVWSWPTPWHDWRRTEQFAGACVSACRAAGVREMVFTMWSDDGGYWEVDSALAGVALVGEMCHGEGQLDDEGLAQRFAAVCGSDLAAHRRAAQLNDALQACSVLWDDPLQALYLRYASRSGTDALRDAAAHYQRVVEALEPHRTDTAAGDLGHAQRVARVLGAKTALAARLFDAYAASDRSALAAAAVEASAVAALIDDLAASFRRRWLACCQPFGLEVIQIRLAGQAARYRELAQRLGEYLAGEVPTIAELDEARKGAYLPAAHLSYRSLASGARVF